MIEFFRDVLSGPLYIITSVLSIILIMAIIGFLMERKKLEKEHNEEMAFVSNNQQPVTPIQPVKVEEAMPEAQNNTMFSNTVLPEQQVPVNTETLENMTNQAPNYTSEVKPPIIVFEDSNQNDK